MSQVGREIVRAGELYWYTPSSRSIALPSFSSHLDLEARARAIDFSSVARCRRRYKLTQFSDFTLRLTIIFQL